MKNSPAPETTREKPSPDLVTVHALVVAYAPNAMEDSFDDGDFQSHDGTELRIIEPASLSGRSLTVFHDEEVAADSLWRAIDQRVAFEIAKSDLDPGITLFNGAITGLRKSAD